MSARDANAESAPVIGIDLGTTFSSIACYKHGRVEVISDKHSQRIIPSLVYYDHKTGVPYVGTTAYDLSVKCPKNLLRDSKRYIGRKFDDESITKYKEHLSQWCFNIVRGDGDEAAFEVEIEGSKVIKMPEEVSAEILKYLKSMAKEYLMEDVTEAVISVPAYFSNSQKKATIKAAEMAGLKVLKLVTEPVAGAIYYLKDRNFRSKMMVFDWGGGTLDISFIEINNRQFEVKGVNGDSLLGGRNFDDILCKHFEKPVKNNSEKFYRRLLNKVIKLKKQLTVSLQAEYEIECYDGENNLTLNLSRAKFESITGDIFKRAIELVMYAVDDMGWSKEDISEVLLVGGTTRIPKIRELLGNFFGADKLMTDLQPDEVVACGACLQAASLRELTDLERFNVTEVTPLSIGCGSIFGLYHVLIPRNSKLPAEGRKTFTTVDNDQTTSASTIYEGERKNINYNNKLAEYSVTGLPPGRAGDVAMHEKYCLDGNGILTITVNVPSTAKTEKVVVTLKDCRLSQNQIAKSIEEAKRMKHEDNLFEEFVKFLISVKNKCKHTLYDIEKISSVTDREFVKEQCQLLLIDMNQYEFTQKDEFEKRYLTFRNSVEDILLANSMLGLEM